MIKVKDGYAKLIGTTYQGSATQVLLSNGGDLGYSASSKASTLVQRNASQHIYATYFNSAISDEALTDIGSVYVRNTSDTFIRRVSKTQFYSILDDKFVTLDTTQSITGAKTFSTSVRFANNASIIQNQNNTSNYTTILKWYKNGASRNTYDPSIGQHNTGGDGNGSICILPYPTKTSPWGGTVGLFISKGVLKLDGKSVALAENYYTKTESDKRYVTLTTNQTVSGIKTFSTQQKFTVATGTSPFTVSSTTVVGNLNSDMLDGYHAASFYQYGYVMFARTIDASALSTSTYYPVTFSIGSHSNVRIECRVSHNSGTKPSWSTHTGGFSVRKIWEVNGSGWGTNPINRRILVSDYAFADSDPVRGVGQLSNSSEEYVYVRGGGKYLFYISHNISATLHTSTYTTNSQSVAPTTSAPAAISTPTLTFSAGKFRALSYKPLTGISTVNIPTNTSHLTNDSGFWTGTRYWANIAVSTTSSTSTQPTFNTCYTSNWFRSTGSTGWYNQTYRGGIYMADSTYVRVYNSKIFYASAGYLAPYIGSTWISMATRSNCIVADQNNSASAAHCLFRAKYNNGNALCFGGLGNDLGFYGFSATNISNGTNSYAWIAKWNSGGSFFNTGSITAAGGFYHNSVNSNNYVLLAGGSYKSLADFAKGNAGASNRGVYVTNGTVTAMTYYLNATVNSGASGKLAYYRGTNSIDDYTRTVGSSGTPIYLSSGVPTACTGVMVKYWASYTINNSSGTSVTYSKNGGNYNFVTSTSRRDTGRYTIGTVYPSGWTWYTTLVWAVGNLNASNSSDFSNSLLYCTLIRGYSSGSTHYWYVNTADDASTNNGSFGLFFLCF